MLSHVPLPSGQPRPRNACGSLQGTPPPTPPRRGVPPAEHGDSARGLRDPGRGLPRDRGAPARGVDVKPSLGEAREGPPGAREGPKRARDRSGTPGGVRRPIWDPGGPRRTPPRGGFYINPSRRGPAVPGGGPGGVPGGPGSPLGLRNPQIPVFRGFWPK